MFPVRKSATSEETTASIRGTGDGFVDDEEERTSVSGMKCLNKNLEEFRNVE